MRGRGATAGALALVALLAPVVACRTEQTLVTPDPHLERMLDQEKVLAYEPDAILPRGTSMQHPPAGTRPFAEVVAPAMVLTGLAGGRWADGIPLAVDRPLVEGGRRSFETFCATCHGMLGDGVSSVAGKMALRRPPSLIDADVSGYPPGRVFRTVREGYGLMPSYAVQLSVRETWGVVAYMRALQTARGARLADLPVAMRERFAREVP